MQFYEPFTRERPTPWQLLALQYADYAIWQRRLLTEETIAYDFKHPGKTNLPAFLNNWSCRKTGWRQARRTYGADVCSITVPAEILAALKRVGHAYDATLYMALLSTFALLLQRYSGQDDIVVGFRRLPTVRIRSLNN